MTLSGYALVGLSAIVAMLVAVMVFAVLRFVAAARDTRGHFREGGAETALLSAALQDAVTRLKAQEQAMSARAVASEQLSAQIVESLSAGLLLVNGSGAVEILNPAGRRMLDIAGDVDGRDFHDLLAVAPPLIGAIAECLSTAQPIVRRSLIMPATLRASHLGVTVSPVVRGASDRGAICLFSDLTNIVELEDQLRMKETLARLGELTAGIAHEFRNGLATIHGYGRLIDPQMLPAQYRPYVDGIRQETEALRQVVTNFLNFARPEQVVLTRIDLGGVVGRAIDDLAHELPDGASVTAEGTFPSIDGDEVLLRQAFSNLVRNAVEACVDVQKTPMVTITGSVDERHRTVRVSVDDNGPGVPQDARAKIFQPFVTTRSRGTGLGLAIVQKIVVLHNGRIAVRESSHGGASFGLVFPLPDRS
jgi:signal transduction histidine kinase